MRNLVLYSVNMSIAEQMGQRIRLIRELKHLTLLEVENRSKASGSAVSKSFISQLENQNVDVSLSCLEALARALEISLTDLVNEKLSAEYIVSGAALNAFCEQDSINAAERASLKELLDKGIVSFSTAKDWREHHHAAKFSQSRRPVLTELSRVAEEASAYRIPKNRRASRGKRNR